MKGIVQIFLGGYQNKNYSLEEIEERITFITRYMPIEKVIIGWSQDKSLYQQLGDFLREKGISMFLWSPVLSELNQLGPAEECMTLWGEPLQAYHLQEGEDFTFFCPTSSINRELFFSNFEKNYEECGFDGIFLDKIRTQSFLGGPKNVLSCGCNSCKSKWESNGISIPKIQKAIREKGMSSFFETDFFSHETGFHLKEPEAQAFFKAKGKIIAEAVGEIAAYFHRKGMEVGMDVYAPFMARFVGQDIKLLAKSADFIKPMMYRETEAPAGMRFEYEQFQQSFLQRNGYPKHINFNEGFLYSQIVGLKKETKAKIYPGIEINYREEFARTSSEYIRRSLKALEKAGCEGCVLSWDVMQAPSEHIISAASYFE